MSYRAVKVACGVLRGGSGGNAVSLPDQLTLSRGEIGGEAGWVSRAKVLLGQSWNAQLNFVLVWLAPAKSAGGSPH